MDVNVSLIYKICISFAFFIGVITTYIFIKYTHKDVNINVSPKQIDLHSIMPIGNATFFIEKCLLAINNTSINRYVYVVLDIDDFKVINKMYGYDVGDKVLEYVGSILKGSITEKEVLARIDSDIFNILLLKEDNIDLLHNRLEEIVKEIQTFDYLGIKLKPSIGVYMIEEADEDITCIGTNAYLARKSIKGNRAETIAYYDKTLAKKIMTNQKLINEFSEALLNKDFKIYYQGKYHLQQGKTLGAEALVRWHHKDEYIISPMSFIELFEYSGDIIDLDLYVFNAVCENIHSWVLKYGKSVKQFNISINISSRTLLTEGIVEKLIEITKKHKISPKYIELELTETFFYDKVEDMLKVVKELKKKNFKISVDDFGSGYSAFTILKDLKVDSLKIDKGFLDTERVATKSKSILESIVDLSVELGLETVAEGVETKEQSAFLKKIGCGYAQGFYYYKPTPSEIFENSVVKPFVMDINAQNSNRNNKTQK